MAAISGIIVKINSFEGPFELLFHLIEKNEMDIYDIPIYLLTAQYMEYIESFAPDMDGMSEFLFMAAALLEIKSQMLLPKQKIEDEEEDPRQRLTDMLVEYKLFKEIALELKDRETDIFFKPPDADFFGGVSLATKADTDKLLEGVTAQKLRDVFLDVMKRRDLSVDKIRAGFGTVTMDRFTVNGKMRDIMGTLAVKSKLLFSRLLLESSCREETVAAFCAVLELIKLKKVTVSQDRNFDDILISGII